MKRMTENYTIEETEDAWRAHFFPNARDGFLYQYPKYQVRSGWSGDIQVPKWCDYYKQYYTREEAEEYASKIENCDCMWILDLEREVSEIIGLPVIAILERSDGC